MMIVYEAGEVENCQNDEFNEVCVGKDSLTVFIDGYGFCDEKVNLISDKSILVSMYACIICRGEDVD